MLELLNVLKETENDDITSVVQKIIATYYDKLAPIMYDICQNLVCILLIFIDHLCIYIYINITYLFKYNICVNVEII